MPVFAVHYDYREDSVAARNAHRPEHRAFLDAQTGPVAILATGPYADDPAGALLIFEGESAAAVEAVLDTDPFALHGLIANRTVREWTQVKGPWAP